MSIINLYSKKQKKLRGEVPEIYTYYSLPNEFRVQIVNILQDAFGRDHSGYHYVNDLYGVINKTLCHEYGVFNLLGKNHLNREKPTEESVLNFFLQTDDIEKALDVIELSFKLILNYIPNNREYEYYVIKQLSGQEALDELNERFKEHGIGYQYIGEGIIKIDSTYTHSEIVKPVISLLWNKKFQGANEEYLLAHEHYRHGRNKECLTECLKAFESTMKIICKEKKWTYNETDTAKKLIQTCFLNNLVPSFIQNQFTSLQNLLESGIPTIRNKLSGHGQGQVSQKVDDEMTRYGLNLTGSNIIFLVEQSGIVY